MKDTVEPAWAIKTEELTKYFNDYPVLRSSDLCVKRGESVVIFGPNGAGKTTLIKIIATIMKPSAGKVIIDGLDTRINAEEARRRLGVVTHQTFLYGNLTAYENLEFYCRMYDVPWFKERIEEAAAIVGMKSRLHDRVSTLSRGMQQRFSLARALLHHPGIVLLDEPESGLDQQAMFTFWKGLTGEGKKFTLLMTTHNLERGLQLADRLLILDHGKIVYESSCAQMDLASLQETYRESTGVPQ